MNTPNIDPGVVTLVQSNFLEHINAAFATTAHYAINLLYFFAVIELTILGIAWALQRDIGWDKLFFKIIKISLMFFIIQNYSWLRNIILYSFTQLAGTVLNDATIAEYVFNPAKIWQFGYNIGIHMFQLAASTEIYGVSLIAVTLGVGILLVFGLLGIQMVLQIVGFYLVSLGSLVLLPFGALASGRNMFDKAVQAVFKAGLRLMVLIIIIGIAIATWNGFELTELATTGDLNLNPPLGLFFTALLFLCSAIYLPKIVSETVGDISSSMFEGGQQTITTIRETAAAPSFAPAVISGSMANMQAATTITPGAGGATYEGTASTAAAATIATPISGTTSTLDSKINPDAMAQASALSRSISEATVKKIKEAVLQAVQDKKTK